MSLTGKLGTLALLAATSIAGAALVGCDTDAFCFDCEDGTTSATTGGSGGTGGVGGGFETTTTGFGPGTGGNCPFDTLTDEKNCGFCGNECQILNAFPVCEGGFCLIEACADGFLDLDQQVTTGCEYSCTPSNGSVEACDMVDNDCNGQVDELFDTTSDKFHCGDCSTVCSFTNAEADCLSSVCMMGACQTGYHDIDLDPTTGCEYQCTETNGGVEVCDNVDNDCDIGVDEGFNLMTDPLNCGICSRNCGTFFPHTVPTCATGQCEMGPCVAGFYDIDGIALNGCEYACAPAAPGAELCDGQDNDCNGAVDDGTLPGIGQPCGATSVGECAFGITVCQGGASICSNYVGPAAEYCDGLDNDCNMTPDNGCPASLATDVRLDVGTGSGVGQANSTQLHGSSRANVVFSAWLDRRAGNSDIRGSVSTNGGTAFTTGTDLAIATTNAVQVEPWTALSPTHAYVAFGEFSGNVRQIRVTRAPSPFTTFIASVRADHQAAGVDSFYPRVVVARPEAAGDDLVVVWQTLSGSGSTTATDVYLNRSLDGGATWLAADVRVNSVAGGAELPSLATDGAGHAYIAWRDQRNGASEAFTAVYDVTAGTLGANIALSGGEAVEQITAAAAEGTARAYVAWTDLRAAKRTIRMNRTSNTGTSWLGDGVIINADSTFADASRPDVTCSAARVAVAWEDTRSGQADIRVAVSTNGGATFPPTTARADLGETAGATASLTPRVALGNSTTVYVIWQDLRDGKGDIYINHSFDGGASFQPFDIRLDVGQPGALSPVGLAESRSPYVFATLSGARAVGLWLDGRTTTGANGTVSDVYANYIE